MKSTTTGSLRLRAVIEQWPLVTPFRITGRTFTANEVIVVTLEADGHVGRGEAAGMYYKNETPASMLEQIEAIRTVLEAGVSRESLQKTLAAGGARNALDCALWDLEAKLTGRAAWQIAELETLRPLVTTFTCGADSPQRMAEKARAYRGARAIKLKLTGEPIDADRVRAVREALPDVWLGVDANQGFTLNGLERLLPVLTKMHVALVEQPFPVGQESLLDGFQSPIPVAADESVQTLADIPSLVGRFNMINIKLDKSGGLTEALAMARAARARGLDVMVGNAGGTSLAMAPAFLVGQLCNVVDLDGPVFQQADRTFTVDYSDGKIFCPDALWGNAGQASAPE